MVENRKLILDEIKHFKEKINKKDIKSGHDKISNYSLYLKDYQGSLIEGV